MSDIVNPFQSPETEVSPVKSPVTQGTLSEAMLMYLKAASPWLRFIGILGFIGSGSTALFGVGFTAFGSFVGQVWAQVPGFESFGNLSSSMGLAFGFLVGVIIIACSLLYFFPSLYIYNFGAKIRTYIREGRDQDLEQAFKNNKSLWKFYGIICIIYLAFIPLMTIIGIIVAVVSAFS